LRGVFFCQLPLGRAAGVAVSKAVRMLCDKCCGATYAQHGEDRQLLHYAWLSPSKFYVDVGCHSPEDHSNTYLLYQMGWSGLCVDANRDLLMKFRKVRPRDRVECVCVGETPGEATFVIASDPKVSHVAGGALVDARAGDEARRIAIPVKSLQQLFEEHNVPSSIGLLSIDVEGVDFAVLRSFDLRRWRPHLILIEIHDLDLENCSANEVVSFLRSAGYRLVGYNTYNALFLDAEGPTR